MNQSYWHLFLLLPALTGWMLWAIALPLGIGHFFLLYKAWSVFHHIPDRRYKPWFIPIEQDKIQMPMMRRMPVRLKLRLHCFDRREEEFTVSVPPRLTMGKLFHHFVLEQRKNDPAAIECEDKQRSPYAWEFYATDFGGMKKRILDPDKDLIENNLQENNTIVAKRVGG